MDPSFQHDLTLYSSIVITVAGILGNSLILLVISKKEFRRVPMFRFLICSTTSDTVTLFFLWGSVFHGFVRRDSDNISCKLFSVLNYLFYHLSTYIMVLCSIERVLSLKNPDLKFFKKFKNQFLLILIIFVALIVLNLPSYFLNTVAIISNDTWCVYLENIPFIDFYVDLYLSIISAFLPFLLMAGCSAIVAHHLLTKRPLQLTKQYKKDKHFVKVIVCLDIFFLVSNLPFYTVSITYDLLNIHYDLLYDIVNITCYIYNSFNFFVYLIVNKRFRKKFIKLFSFRNLFDY